MTKAANLRARIVQRMESENDAADIPIFWRLDDEGRACMGTQSKRQDFKIWRVVHPLSTHLCALKRAAADAADDALREDDDLPF